MARSTIRARGAVLQQTRITGGTDTTAPTITSTNAYTAQEGTAFSGTGAANETVTWTKGGTDTSLVTLNASTGAWSVPAQVYATKPSVVFTLTATDTAGNATTQTITLTTTQTPTGVDYMAEPAVGSLDMTTWNVSIPVANSSGTATTIDPATEAAVSAQSAISVATVHTYYQILSRGIRFAVPWDSIVVTSSNTSYPRSELRELNWNGSAFKNIDWDPSINTHNMDVKVRVESLTMRADGNYAMTDIGQIHGASDEVCRFFYRPIENGGTVAEIGYYNDQWNTSTSQSAFRSDDTGTTSGTEGNVVLRKGGLLTGAKATVSLGEWFTYNIHVEDNILTISAMVRGESYSHWQQLHSAWAGDECYFKAGNYRQANKNSTSSSRKATSGTTVVMLYNVVKTHSAGTTFT